VRPREDDATRDGGVLGVTWLGHSTVLLELDGVRLVTDPVLRGRLAHLRRVAARVDADALGPLDAVLVSHLHYDHLDVPSLRRLGREVHVVVPSGAGRLLRKRRFTHLSELAVGDELRVGPVTVTATEAVHEGRRLPFGADTPAVGYLVGGGARVYFAGDTDLFDGMSDLAADLDVALVPISGWGPRVPAGHLDPLGAAKALRLLRPRVAVPIHWGTFRPVGLRRAAQLLRAPAEAFVRHAAELAPDVDVRVLAPAGRLELSLPLAAEARS